jgi:arsenate reductase
MMTCSDADENCPFLPGTLLRIPFRFTDPKHADDTDHEAEAYDACSEKIKSDLKEIFQLVKKQL